MHPARRYFLPLAVVLALAWGALAVWFFAPQWLTFSPVTASGSPEDVSGLFHIPGVQVRLLKAPLGTTYATLGRGASLSENCLRSLNQANDGSEPEPGGEVLIPTREGLYHWVLSGQGLDDIAKAYGVPLQDLMAANLKANDSELKAGEVLYLPRGNFLQRTDPRWIALAGLGSKQGFEKPTTGRFADGFGWRVHPLTGKRNFHAGLDLAPGFGHKVYATQSGRVAFSGIRAGYGRLIILDHGGGLSSWYGHLSESRVVPQQQVLRGDWIGRVGATGMVTGPHLHFEIRKDGKPQNPLLYLEK